MLRSPRVRIVFGLDCQFPNGAVSCHTATNKQFIGKSMPDFIDGETTVNPNHGLRKEDG